MEENGKKQKLTQIVLQWQEDAAYVTDALIY